MAIELDIELDILQIIYNSCQLIVQPFISFYLYYRKRNYQYIEYRWLSNLELTVTYRKHSVIKGK